MGKNLDGSWYINGQLDFDKKLIEYRYRTLKNFIKPSFGLELGPAEGEMTKFLVEHFAKLVSVDGSKELLNMIPNYKNHAKVHSLFEDFATDEKFDTILMEHILEHVDNPVKLLQMAMNWLKDDGVILLGVPNANSIHRQAAVKMGLLNHVCQLNDRDMALGHRRVYTFKSLKEDILVSGLKVVETGGVYFKPLSNQQMEANWSDLMIEGFFELGKDYPDLCAEIYAVCRKK